MSPRSASDSHGRNAVNLFREYSASFGDDSSASWCGGDSRVLLSGLACGVKVGRVWAAGEVRNGDVEGATRVGMVKLMADSVSARNRL